VKLAMDTRIGWMWLERSGVSALSISIEEDVSHKVSKRAVCRTAPRHNIIRDRLRVSIGSEYFGTVDNVSLFIVNGLLSTVSPHTVMRYLTCVCANT
jgi:hypothetical protein